MMTTHKILKVLALTLLVTIFYGCKEDEDPQIKEDPESNSVTIENFSTTINENPNTGALLGTVQATASDGSDLSFLLINPSVAGALIINNSTGELTVADSADFDFEINKEITANVIAESGEVADTASISINIENLELPQNGLVGYWPFNGNANDVAGTADAIVSDGVILNADRFGNTDAAYNFNDNGQFIDAGDQDYFAGNDHQFSIAVWIKPNGVDALGKMILAKFSQQASFEGCNEFQEELSLQIDQQGRFRAVYYEEAPVQAGRAYRVIISPSFVDYESPFEHGWLHLVISYDHSINSNNGLDRLNMYVDGVKQTLSMSGELGNIPTQILNTDSHLGFGNTLNSQGEVCLERAFRGGLDDIAIYDRILTSNEIALMAEDRY